MDIILSCSSTGIIAISILIYFHNAESFFIFLSFSSIGVRIHHLPSNSPLNAFFAPEFSVPAIGCPGMKFEIALIFFIVDFLNMFLTEPVSVIKFFLLTKGTNFKTISSIKLTGVHIKINSLLEIL